MPRSAGVRLVLAAALSAAASVALGVEVAHVASKAVVADFPTLDESVRDRMRAEEVADAKFWSIRIGSVLVPAMVLLTWVASRSRGRERASDDVPGARSSA
jgi:hypothetical protein